MLEPSLGHEVCSLHHVGVESKGWSTRLHRLDKAQNATVKAGSGSLLGPLPRPRTPVYVKVRASDEIVPNTRVAHETR